MGAFNQNGGRKMKEFLDDKKKMPGKYLKEQNLRSRDISQLGKQMQKTSSKMSY